MITWRRRRRCSERCITRSLRRRLQSATMCLRTGRRPTRKTWVSSRGEGWSHSQAFTGDSRDLSLIYLSLYSTTFSVFFLSFLCSSWLCLLCTAFAPKFTWPLLPAGSVLCPITQCLGWFNSFAGDVKRRFASYLKVNLTEERRLRNEEFNCQKAQNAPQAFAPTNPFLDASDSYLVAAPPPAAEQAADKYKLDRRHRSPDPPPRYNRQSPLLLRKKLEMTNWGGSPLLSRRWVFV